MTAPPTPKSRQSVRWYSRALQRVVDPLTRIKGDGNHIAISPGMGGIVIRFIGALLPLHLLAFWFRLTRNKCKVYSGTVTIHNRHEFDAEETTLTLTGSTEFVYVEIPVAASSGTATIKHAAEWAPSNDSHIRVRYYKFESHNGGQSYRLTKIYRLGNADFASPI